MGRWSGIARAGTAGLSAVLAAAGLAVAGALPAHATATAFHVTTTADSGAGSLRQAILDANGTGNTDAAVPDTIDFSVPAASTITLASNLPSIKGALTITGPGADTLTISGADLYALFYVDYPAALRISGLTVAHGYGQYAGCLGSDGISYLTDMVFDHCTAWELGGALDNGTSATMSLLRTVVKNSAMVGSAAGGGGGGIVNSGTMTLDHVTVTGNSSDLKGGGMLQFDTGASLTIVDSTVSDNTSLGSQGGGGIFVQAGQSSLTRVTVTGNSETGGALGGGGIAFFGAEPHVVTDSVISANSSAHRGGGIYKGLSGSLTMSGSTVSGNSAAVEAGGIGAYGTGDVTATDVAITTNTSTGAGGGVYTNNTGLLSLTRVEMSGNTAGGAGGGMYSERTASVDGSTFSGNTAGTFGGGIAQAGTRVLTLASSSVSGNTANGGLGGGGLSLGSSGGTTLTGDTIAGNRATGGGGGGIRATTSVSIDQSTISGNTALEFGAGIAVTAGASMTASRTTVASNVAGTSGGGVFVQGASSLIQSTVVGNSAEFSTDASGVQVEATGSMTFSATVVAHGSGTGTDCQISGTVVDDGHTIATDGTCALTSASSAIVADPKLGPLQDNGGPTQTVAPLAGSALLDAIAADNAACTNSNKDQRGVSRPQHGACDIGAVEDRWGTFAGNATAIPYGSLYPKFTLTVTPTPDFSSSPGFRKPGCAAYTYTATSPPGDYPVTCFGGGAGGWIVEYVTGTMTVVKADQSAPTVTSLAGVVGTPLMLTASSVKSTGGLNFTVASGGTAGCVRTGLPGAQVVNATSAGTCTVTVMSNGDTSYNPSVESAPATLTFSAVAPSAPRSPSGSPRSKAVVVSWLAPSFTGGAAITGYTVTSTTKVGSAYPKCAASGTQRSCTVAGLVNGRSYAFRVRARNSAGMSLSSVATVAVVAGAPSAPRSPAVSQSSVGKAKVTWLNPSFVGSGAVTGYRVRWCRVGGSCATWAALPATARSASVASRVKGAKYRVDVVARNGSGGSPMASKAFTQTR